MMYIAYHSLSLLLKRTGLTSKTQPHLSRQALSDKVVLGENIFAGLDQVNARQDAAAKQIQVAEKDKKYTRVRGVKIKAYTSTYWGPVICIDPCSHGFM